MESPRILFLIFGLWLLATTSVAAEKLPSSLSQDYGTKTRDQSPSMISPIPSPAPVPKTPSVTTFPDNPTPTVAAPSVPMPEETIIPVPAALNPNFSAPVAPTLKNPFELKSPRISRPDFEEQFQRLQQREAEEKSRKKRKLSEAIREEMTKYGLFFLLGLAAILLFYALRKEGSPSKAPVEEKKKPREEPRDIWKEDF